MKIYTGYYGNLRAYKGMALVAISLSQPRWLSPRLPQYDPLFPERWMLKMERPEYTEIYDQILGRVIYPNFIDWLKSVSGDKDVVLLCYEKPSDFCHRQLVAEWINNHGEFNVTEFAGAPVPVPKPPPEPESQQMELF